MPRIPRAAAIEASPSDSEEDIVHRSKKDELTDALRRRVITMPAGQRMPSIRGLMKRYNLSMQTVTAALNQLESENLIVSRPGSGTYVSDCHVKKLIVMHRSYNPSHSEDFRDNSIREAIMKAGWHMITHRHEAKPDEHPTLAPEPLASAHLVSQDVANLRPDLLDDLISQGVPVVGLERTIAGRPTLDSILHDDTQADTLMAEYMKSLGHRNLAAVLNEPNFPEAVDGDTVFLSVLKELGLGVTMIDCKTKPRESSAEMAYRSMKLFLARHRKKLPFTAISVASAPGGAGVLRALHEFKVKVPRQCSVACFGWQFTNSILIPALTEVAIPYDAWGQAVVQLLERRFASGDKLPISMRLPAKLFIRESTVKCFKS